jgi:hypothetical protein
MNRMAALVSATLLVVGAGGGALPIAGSQTTSARGDSTAIYLAWDESYRGEHQAPRTMMPDDTTSAPRVREIQAPRGDGVQAPRAEDAKAPRASEIQPPRWRED